MELSLVVEELEELDLVSLRISRLLASPTYTLPLPSTATPKGFLNDAAVPVPFVEPTEPLPANVVTSGV